jgi:GNAT superfamily N-acetyltransferase
VQAVEDAAATMFDDNGLLDGIPDEPTDAASLRAAVREARLWVAVVDGRSGEAEVLGFALARWCGPDAHLQELDVVPKWGRRGIGRRLVAEVMAWAVEHDRPRVTLTTFTSVPWNAPFYERLGFAVLPHADWTDALRETWEHERSMGLPMDQRVTMTAPTRG